MPVTAADVEAYGIPAPQGAIGRLHMAHRTAIAETNAVGDGDGVVHDGGALEDAQHLPLGDAGTRRRKRGVNREAGNARSLP